VYARQVRIRTAQRLLLATDTPLAQVAAHAGFADQAHLTRVLRAALGNTPGRLRRSGLHRFNT
jgi:AraC family transcriptional regulator